MKEKLLEFALMLFIVLIILLMVASYLFIWINLIYGNNVDVMISGGIFIVCALVCTFISA